MLSGQRRGLVEAIIISYCNYCTDKLSATKYVLKIKIAESRRMKYNYP